MKTLLLFRHAKSSRDEPVISDHERPLNERGLSAAPMMGTFFKKQQLPLDLIISSTALRARQTTELFIPKAGYTGEVNFTREIYDAQAPDIILLLKNVDNKYNAVMLVGHNPTFEDVGKMLGGLSEELPTAAIARIELPIDYWQELSAQTKGRLIDLWRPKELAD